LAVAVCGAGLFDLVVDAAALAAIGVRATVLAASATPVAVARTDFSPRRARRSI
jgi:hypothetical protein